MYEARQRDPNPSLPVPGTHAILLLHDVLGDGGQRCPLAVVDSLDCTALVGLELTDCNTKGRCSGGDRWPQIRAIYQRINYFPKLEFMLF